MVTRFKREIAESCEVGMDMGDLEGRHVENLLSEYQFRKHAS